MTHSELDTLLTKPEDPPTSWARLLSKVELAEPLETEIHLTDFDEWARGAAATAIQSNVIGGF